MMKEEIVYDGYLKIKATEGVNKNGTSIKREVMSRTRSGNDYSVAGTLYDTEKNVFYLVSQYRAGAATEDERYITEVVAGTMEEGEEPKECFTREAMEEVGFDVKQIVGAGSYYTSPGGTSEKIFLFHATGIKTEIGGGLAEENEDIEIIELTFDEIVSMLQKREINDIKTRLLLIEVYMSITNNK